MRLATFHREHQLVAGFVIDDQLVDATIAAGAADVRHPEQFASVRSIVTLPVELRDRVHDQARQLAHTTGPATVTVTSARLAAPVPDPDKIVCLGLNYRDHATETAQEPPAAPMLFAKYRNSLVGHEAPIRLPQRWPDEVDYEGEIAVVVGQRLQHGTEPEATAAVVGWMPFNDVSARDLQRLTPQWTAGKAVDGFGPCGPYLTLDDGFLQTGGLELSTRLNGETVQHATTDDMLFPVAHTLRFLSSFMTLLPGDIVVTGTPAGIGMSREPQRFLRHGDVIEVQVGDCVLRNPVLGPTSEPTPVPRAVVTAT